MGGYGDRVACSCWDPDEADQCFGRNRSLQGLIYCDKCSTPAAPEKEYRRGGKRWMLWS